METSYQSQRRYYLGFIQKMRDESRHPPWSIVMQHESSDTRHIIEHANLATQGMVIREMATPIFGSFVSKNGHPHRYIKFADKDAPTPDNLSINQADTEAVLIEALYRRGTGIQWGAGQID